MSEYLLRRSCQLAGQVGYIVAAAHANKPGDNTHFNETGARAMVELVMKELPVAEARLKGLLKGR